MDSLPLVSVVVTTYKREPEIVRRALDSVLQQDYANMQILLVNDYPEGKELAEKLKALAGSYCGSVEYIEMKKNGGACAARNYGLEYAKGEYIAFLDDDDQWLPDKISQQLNRFDSKVVGIVYCNVIAVYDESGKECNFYSHDMPEGNIYPDLFAMNIVGSASFPLLRKSVVEDAGGFNVEMPALQDLELWLRMARSCEARYVKEPLVRYHYYVGDKISAHPERRIKGYEIIANQHADYLNENPKVCADFCLFGTSFYIDARNFKKAGEYYRKAVKLNPLSLKRNIYIFCKFIFRFFKESRYH